MQEEYDSIDRIAYDLKRELDSSKTKKKVTALYAFNATGKTRITNILDQINEENEDESIKVLCYNSSFEDIFQWNNQENILIFNSHRWMDLIKEQGLEKDVINNFKDIIDSKLEPVFNFIEGEIMFKIASGDEKNQDNIKISRGEESAFMWSIFHTIVQTAIDNINTEPENRATRIFDKLEYIIIDDPVSSIDDTKIITTAINLIETIKSCEDEGIKYLITTHHALFYNVLINSFNNIKSHVFSKEGNVFTFKEQGDSPFAYHLYIRDIIELAIENNTLEKYHFNLFRNILEKTSNFLGHKAWGNCISSDRKEEFARLINLYSHNKLSDLENRNLSYSEKELFKEVFNNFIKDYKWSNKVNKT